jgi:hypothetical protein
MLPTQSAPSVHHVSARRLFLGDVYIALRMLNKARHRIMAAVFGVPMEGSNLIWLIAVGAIVRGLRRAAATPSTQVRKVRSSPTAVGDSMIGAATLKETLDSVAGHPSRDTSSAAALIAFAVLAHSARPAVEGSLRAVRESSRAVIAEARRVRARFTARAESGRYD